MSKFEKASDLSAYLGKNEVTISGPTLEKDTLEVYSFPKKELGAKFSVFDFAAFEEFLKFQMTERINKEDNPSDESFNQSQGNWDSMRSLLSVAAFYGEL